MNQAAGSAAWYQDQPRRMPADLLALSETSLARHGRPSAECSIGGSLVHAGVAAQNGAAPLSDLDKDNLISKSTYQNNSKYSNNSTQLLRVRVKMRQHRRPFSIQSSSKINLYRRAAQRAEAVHPPSSAG
jgi:hypothetical protein